MTTPEVRLCRDTVFDGSMRPGTTPFYVAVAGLDPMTLADAAALANALSAAVAAAGVEPAPVSVSVDAEQVWKALLKFKRGEGGAGLGLA